MVWTSLAALRTALAAAHHYLQLRDGRWMRTLGPPDGAVCIRGKVWRAA